MAGIAQLHELIGQHVGLDEGELDDPAQVVVGIETDRGPWVQALLAVGYQVFAINPLSVARYRERHTTTGSAVPPPPELAQPGVTRARNRLAAGVLGDMLRQ